MNAPLKALWFGACMAASLLALPVTVKAVTFTFASDPFAGSTALTTPGRQIVGAETSISFDIATDLFAFDPRAFGLSALTFANNVAGSLPASGVNTIVLRSFDNDANSGTPFGAGNAADLIAGRLTADGAGFFVYFNQGLDVPRLAFSTNLNDPTADLKILARLTNLSGQTGRDAMADFTSANFQLISTPVPDSSGPWTLLIAVGSIAGLHRLIHRRRSLPPRANRSDSECGRMG